MTRVNRFIGVALTCLTAAASVGYVQAGEDRRDVPATENRAPGKALRAKDILGSKVSLQGGLAIGTVADIILDDDGYIDFLVVLNEGKFVTVPWEAAKFDFEKRTATVEVAPEKFRDIPTYTQEQYPTFYEPAYREKIYTYYGVKPRRDVHVEKREDKRDEKREERRP